MKKLFILLVSIILISSCQMPSYDDSNAGNNDLTKSDIQENTELFVQNIVDNTYCFQTNDNKYLSKYGYTLWKTGNTNVSSDFEDINYKLLKESGNNEAGFGLIFCKQKLNNKDFMLSVLINTKGQYIIGKITDGKFEAITRWKKEAYLATGFGIWNKIKVIYDKDNKFFHLFINENDVKTFSVDEEISFNNSKSGFVVVISDTEKFPAIPVKVIFQKQ